MNKIWIGALAIIILAIGGYFVGTNFGAQKSGDDAAISQSEQAVAQPERKPEIYGKIKSIVGNEVTVTKTDSSVDPTADMTPEQKRKYMQSLDETERTKLKETILNATLGDVKVIVAVGLPMVKKTAQGPDAETIPASLADLKVGNVISIWLDATKSDRNVAEFVKVAFTN